MPTRRSQAAPDPDGVVRELTPESIEAGIRKLNRRIEEVKAFGDGREIAYNDPRVEGASRNVRADLIEIFGKASQEFRAHGAHSIGYSAHVFGRPPGEYQRDFIQELPRTVSMLEGLIRRLEEKREDLGIDKTAKVRSSFEGLDLHPRIAEASADLYRGKHYRHAVLDGSLALQDYVKQKSRCRDRDGADLMRYVFSVKNPVIAFNDLTEETDRSEQEGMMHLFEGVMLALRNPRAHSLLDDSPEEALEYIALLSLLAKRLESAQRVREP